mmetsp:Transcript_25340/g.72997  ORF Transcript_25340/g.72997 Transcript_25340/m.72997 type:complete len:222 (+) Transcript_25340:476-1141(+)
MPLRGREPLAQHEQPAGRAVRRPERSDASRRPAAAAAARGEEEERLLERLQQRRQRRRQRRQRRQRRSHQPRAGAGTQRERGAHSHRRWCELGAVLPSHGGRPGGERRLRQPLLRERAPLHLRSASPPCLGAARFFRLCHTASSLLLASPELRPAGRERGRGRARCGERAPPRIPVVFVFIGWWVGAQDTRRVRGHGHEQPNQPRGTPRLSLHLTSQRERK